MPFESSADVKFEIGHVLFIDLVGYSKLLITEQSDQLQTLRQIVRSTEQFKKAEAEGKLLRLPTGDGGALVFRNNPEAPVLCALEISKALKSHSEIKVRMGIHSGPVNEITDLNEQANIAGAGINIAQRVMDCGDAGHILLSRHVADDLEEYPQWRSHLAELGEFEVKHGVRVSVVNLYTDEAGNPALPSRMTAQKASSSSGKRMTNFQILTLAALLLIGLGLPTIIFTPAIVKSLRSGNSADKTSPLSLPEKSIAVLPFENLSRDPDNAFFTDGVQDEILTDLSRIADLKVISRTSVMQYKTGAPRNLREISQQLGVAHVVEGSVQRAANKVRVNAQLIDARNDTHLWAQTYDRDLADVFAIQSEIAKAIADQLQARLSPAEKNAIEQRPTTDVAAFELYSRAKDLILNTGFSALAAQNLRSGIDLLNQALARDPSFFAAQCQLALAHANLYGLFDHTPERRALAEAAVDAAFRLRPDAGDAHLARATYLYSAYRDYGGALTELEIAGRTLPNDPRIFQLTAAIMRRQGKHDEGLRNFQRAVELDPRNFYTLQQLSLSYTVLRRYAEEASTLDRALSIKPDDPETKASRALVSLDWKADTRPLHQMIDEIRSKNPTAIRSVADVWFICALAERDGAAAETALTALGDASFGDNSTQFNSDFGHGLLGRMLNDENKARAAFSALRPEQEKIVHAQPDYGPAVCTLALIDAALGRKEEALREIRRAAELMPVEKDSLNGADMIQYSAVVAAWVGEKDLALQHLAKAAALPGFLSYGRLKLLPWWDPLRGDPRFEQIVASLASKEP
jgi:TolB-like protein/class 3 adenylate cyclase/Flp pilus assembly protein TadD